MKIHLVIIDPQNDFCDPAGSLFVPGADRDIERLATMLDRFGDRIEDIHVTLDSHRKVDISHPMWWRSPSGNRPDPFTQISADDLRTGRWNTARPALHERTLGYLETLEANGRYPHTVWPYHCLIGDEGHGIAPRLAAALHAWEDRFAVVDMITKGSNPWTEHFSGVQAEVPDPQDPGTQLNTGFVDTLQSADIILMAGEALSHCLANTVRDIAHQFGSPDLIKKIHLLTDASSSVPGFESHADTFVRELSAQGMTLTTTQDAFAA